MADLFVEDADLLTRTTPTNPNPTLSTCQETGSKIPTSTRHQGDERRQGFAPTPVEGGKSPLGSLVAFPIYYSRGEGDGVTPNLWLQSTVAARTGRPPEAPNMIFFIAICDASDCMRHRIAHFCGACCIFATESHISVAHLACVPQKCGFLWCIYSMRHRKPYFCGAFGFRAPPNSKFLWRMQNNAPQKLFLWRMGISCATKSDPQKGSFLLVGSQDSP